MESHSESTSRPLAPASRPPVMPLPASSLSAPVTPSPFRAWCYLIWLSFQRLARAQQMVWIALILLAFTATVIALINANNRWSMNHWRYPRGVPRDRQATYQQIADNLQDIRLLLPYSPPAAAIQDSVALAT